MGGLFFNDVATITPAFGLPRIIGATTFTTDTFNVAGFNTFMAVLDVTGGANITFKFNHIDPRDQTTILATRSIVTVVSGTGLTAVNFGFGNAVGLGGADVFYFIQLVFTGLAGGATINQFPGLWGCVR
jgi:hypothetical protein